ncbi:hypothetical protein [Sphingopyxis sp.]|uniref:hypothetical protein n=1 Tax=Sphingopyxis sp. TaxID=1908224 RepID=UPI002E0EAEA5
MSFTMMKNIALSRPATSAIAAFLVLSTPAAFAQEAPSITMTPPIAAPTAPAPQTPPTVAEPSAPAPIAVPQTAQTPAPAPVIRVPLDIAPAETTPAPRAAERAEAPAPAAQRTRSTSAAPVAAAPVAATVAETAPAAELAPIAAPMAAPADPVTTTTPTPAETATATGGEFPWEIAGGAAALLLVGGIGLAFARRRRHADNETAHDAVVHDATVQRFEPIAASAPVASDAQQWVSPAYAPRTPETVAPRTTPAFAAAPSGSMGRHEAMAMAGPTPENPFATLSKRLKRARFLDRQERIAYEQTLGAQKDMVRKPVSAWEIAQRPAPATQQQDVRRPEPARARTSFRPGYSSN